MGEKNPMDPCIVKFSGLYDWEKLYQMIRDWFGDRKFEFTEKKLKHKYGSPLGYDAELDLIGERKVDEYLLHQLKLSFKIWDYTIVEAIKNGKKVKMSKARFQIEFSGYLEMDYENKWEETNFYLKLRNFFHKFIIKQKLLNEWDVLYYQMLSLETDIKKFLGMETGVSAY